MNERTLPGKRTERTQLQTQQQQQSSFDRAVEAARPSTKPPYFSSSNEYSFHIPNDIVRKSGRENTSIQRTGIPRERPVMSPRKAIGQTFDESEEPGLANQINLSVAKGAEKLEAFEKAVEQLISTLKEQHDTMIAFSDARLETAKLFETLVANTPLTKAMGEKDVEKDKAAVFKKKKPAPEQPVDAATIGSTNLSNSETPIVSVKKTQVRNPPSGAEDSRMSKNKADMLPAEDEEITLDTDLVEKTHEDESVDAAEDVKASFSANEEDPLVTTSTSNKNFEEDAPATIPFEKQVKKRQPLC